MADLPVGIRRQIDQLVDTPQQWGAAFMCSEGMVKCVSVAAFNAGAPLNDIPSEVNLLLVKVQDASLRPPSSLVAVLARRQQPLILICVLVHASERRIKAWRFQAGDIEAVETLALNQALNPTELPPSHEVFAVVAASVVALVVLVIIALNLLPAAPLLSSP